MIYKRCSRCGKRIPSGTQCSCKSKRYKEEDKLTAGSKEKNFYNSNAWKKTRKRAIDICNGLDLYSYHVLGKIEYGHVVHHIQPIEDNWDRRLDIKNLIYLTESNHQLIHKVMRQSTDSKENIMTILYDLVNNSL